MKSRHVALMMFLSLFAGHANAASITVQLVGEVTGVSGVVVGNSFFNLGDAITYNLEFDEELASSSPIDTFTSAITSFSGSVGTYDFAGSTGQAFTRNNGTAGSLFGGNPFDQISISHNDLDRNLAFLGLNRNDFTSDDGLIGGKPLAQVRLSAQTDDTSFMSSNDFDASIFQALAGNSTYLDLLGFSMSFDIDAFGSVDGTASGEFNSITVVPEPSTGLLLSLGLITMLASRRCSRNQVA